MKRFTMRQTKDFINFVNNEVSQLKTVFHIPLGPEYANLGYDQALKNLTLYRATNKFAIPDSLNAAKRKKDTIDSVISYDQAGLSEFNPVRMDMDVLTRKALYDIRSTLHSDLSSYRIDLRSAEITTGESFFSSRGDTSLLAKLRDRKQWCVTPDCFDLFSTIAYNNTFLKRAVKRLWWEKAREVGPIHTPRLRGSMNERAKAFDYNGYKTFRSLLKEVVTFVHGFRMETVPKDNVKDRVIGCEPMCNMITQRAIGISIRSLIKTQFDIDLETSQDLHKRMILDSSNSTIDLSNASNSNWMSVVRWLYKGTKLLSHVENARSKTFSVGDKMCGHLNMVAPMGNGFTFELMTLTLLLTSRWYDSFSHVYGDDIIIDSDVAVPYVDLLNVLGYKVNVKKTFISGNFRESCGGFVSEGLYLHTYDLHYSENLLDAIVTCNKLKQLSNNGVEEIKEMYHRIIRVAPAALFCCEHPMASLDDGITVPVPFLKRLHRKTESLRTLYQKKLKKHGADLKAIQVSHVYVRCVVKVLRHSYSRIPDEVETYSPYFAYYLGAGLRKPTRGARTFVNTSNVLCEIGCIFPLLP